MALEGIGVGKSVQVIVSKEAHRQKAENLEK